MLTGRAQTGIPWPGHRRPLLSRGTGSCVTVGQVIAWLLLAGLAAAVTCVLLG